jgi:hypothetical protein
MDLTEATEKILMQKAVILVRFSGSIMTELFMMQVLKQVRALES